MGKKLVLVVEDDALLQEAYKDLLELGGIEVLQAWTLGEAKSLFELHAESLGVIVLDGELPDGTTVEFARQAMHNSKFEGGIIAASGNGKVVKQFKRIGLQHAYTKPVPGEFLDLVESLL